MKPLPKKRRKTSAIAVEEPAFSRPHRNPWVVDLRDWDASVSEEIRKTIEPYFIHSVSLSACLVSCEIEEAINEYKINTQYEHIEDVTGFKPRSDKNRKNIERYLTALEVAKEFFDNGQHRIAVMGKNESLPFRETHLVLDKAIETLKQNRAAASRRGRPKQHAREILIKTLRIIWEEYTGKPAGTSIATKSGGPFVRFARAVATPILHENDKKGFDEALIAIRKRVGKNQA